MRISALLATLVLVWGCKKDPETEFVDLDGDGYTTEDDCDDTLPNIHPGATEICDGIDQNCDTVIDNDLRGTYYRDGDSDGFGDPDDAVDECNRPAGFVTEGGDCDDTRSDVYPGAVEQCDPVDHDCDGSNTEGAPGNTTFYLDSDNDGFGDRLQITRACEAPAGYVANDNPPGTNNEGYDCDDGDVAVNPGADELCATPYDDDCDGTANVGNVADGVQYPIDADGDGYGHETVTYEACGAGVAFDIDMPPDGITDFVTVAPNLNTDCNDSDDTVNPNAPEICDGIDNDCDPTTDENVVAQDTQTWYLDADNDGAGVSTTTLTACVQPTGYAPPSVGIDCNDADPNITPTGVEYCGDGIDNNCDNQIDDPSAFDATEWWTDLDDDGFGNAASLSIFRCTQPSGYADNDYDCNDLEPAVGAPPPQFLDSDGDGYGDPLVSDISCTPLTGYVSNDLDCDDTLVAINPDTPWYLDNDGDGYGQTGSTITQCLQPTGYADAPDDCDDTLDTVNPGETDLCDGIDNDCDGDTDEDCTVEHCGTISADETWAAGFIHLVTCDVRVQGAGAPVLTIEDGADVRFRSGAQLRVGVTAAQPGVVQAFGGPLGIRFRSEFPASPVSWDGIELGPGQDPNNPSIFENVTIEHAAGIALRVDRVAAMLDGVTIDGTNGAGISLLGTSTLSMSNSVISNGLGRGITAQAASMLDIFQNNTITGNAGEPLVVGVTSLAALDDGNSYAGNGVPFIGLLGGTIADDVTMALLDADYRIDGDVLVQGGGSPALTIEDGVWVEFSAGTGLTVGTAAQGSLDVQGTALGVTFTGTSAVEGHWDGLYIDRNANDSSIVGLDVSYGGGNGFGNIRVRGDSAVPEDERSLVTLDGVVSASSSTAGLYAEHAKLVVLDSVFEDNLENGAEILDVVFNESSVDTSTFQDNAESAVRISPDLVELLQNNTFAGNQLPIEIVPGVVSRDATWIPLDEPYYVTGTVRVEDVSGPVLTLAAGTTIYHSPSGFMRVGDVNQGSLVTEGPAAGGTEDRVLFSALTEYLGTPSVRGSFQGLRIGNQNRESRLQGLTVRYGGSGTGGININGGGLQPIELSNVVVERSGSHGIYALNPELWIHDSTFQNNDDVGVFLDEDTALTDMGGRSFSGNVIVGNGLHAMELDANSIGQLDTTTCQFFGNQVVSGEPDRIAFHGRVLDTQTWENPSTPGNPVEYWMNTETIVVGGQNRPTLTIDPGVRVAVASGTDFAFLVGLLGEDGGIYAVGTAVDPIVFTSDEDFVGGVPAHGDWRGIEIGADCIGSESLQGHCVLDHVNIDYAGSLNEEAALSIVTRRNIPELFPVYIRNIRQRYSGSSGFQWQAESGVIVPTPTPLLPIPWLDINPAGFGPEDYDYPFGCEGFPTGSSVAFSGCATFDLCYDAVNGTHGQTNLFCDNIESNVTARNFRNPFTWLDCSDVALDDGPTFCP
ncbi:MAG: right-handed parallel beta-helix repeat-containing protein [Alphaproteobacteria bacterium]|nr:right-handed parallel beta-helix repeat-containing protein [Alphaproteobacteria bacterium]